MRKLAMHASSLALVAISSIASARDTTKPVWTVSRTSDPITGASSCVVAAYDRAGGMSFTRTGGLYPFVENSSTHGILVGVSSGGPVRFPTGDIVWRVDDKPFRTLRAANNPPASGGSPAANDTPNLKSLIDMQMRFVAEATATSTVASGQQARDILNEMLAGQGLLYRAAAATSAYGLPEHQRGEVGRYTKDGLRPYPLDASFRAGLVACGVPTQAT